MATAERIAVEPPAWRPLGRADWIGQGLRLLIEEGVEAIRITRLAEAMGVTRGSFYWHFRDRDDLLDALLDRWQATNTAAVVAALDQASDLTGGILELFDVWLDSDRFDPRLDSAIRDWARRSEPVRHVVEAADLTRVTAIAAFFSRNGFPDPDALVRARILYFSQVGYYALAIDETLVQRFSYLEAYFEGFTGRALDPEIAAGYRAQHLGRNGNG